jgi:(p)ppGpp synthase/HD superfamily hydrolase
VRDLIKDRENMPWHKIPVWKFAKENNSVKTNRALFWAREILRFTKRKDGRNEFIHAYRVAQILIFHGVRDDRIIAAGILHDVLENISFALLEEIDCAFEEQVALIVWILSRKKGEADKFYFAQIGEDVVTILVKLADRLHNLRNMDKNLGKGKFFTKKRLLGQVEETWEYIVPLAVRAAEIDCEYREMIVEIHEEILRSLADAEWAIANK